VGGSTKRKFLSILPWLRRHPRLLGFVVIAAPILGFLASHAKEGAELWKWAREEVGGQSERLLVTILANDYRGTGPGTASHRIRIRLANLLSENVALQAVYITDWEDGHTLSNYKLVEDQLGKPIAPGNGVDVTYETPLTARSPSSTEEQRKPTSPFQFHTLHVQTSAATIATRLSSYSIAEPVPHNWDPNWR